MRKLFDKEIDNHHEEALLAAQLSAWQLRTLLCSLQGAALAQLKSAVAAWLLQVMQACAPLSQALQFSSWAVLGMTQKQCRAWALEDFEDVPRRKIGFHCILF